MKKVIFFSMLLLTTSARAEWQSSDSYWEGYTDGDPNIEVSDSNSMYAQGVRDAEDDEDMDHRALENKYNLGSSDVEE